MSKAFCAADTGVVDPPTLGIYMNAADDDSYISPEQQARRQIDKMLVAAGWEVQDYRKVNLRAGVGVAVRELVTNAGPADYVLFVDRQAVGVIEAKKKGTTLSGVEWQTVKYQGNVPDELPAYRTPKGRLPFSYESTGSETWYTCQFDLDPTARQVFWFHKPETFRWAIEDDHEHKGGSLRARIARMPDLAAETPWLRAAQSEAIRNLETSLKTNHDRALIQMATGSGKTYCAANVAERLINLAGAKRILFLVDRSNLGIQTLKEFQGFEVPGTGRKFSELYGVQLLQSHRIDDVASVCVATVQRVYSMLRGEAEIPDEVDELGTFENAPERPVEVDYQPKLSIEDFDVIIIDECHRSIYGLWRQVLEYFDALLIGLTATPGTQTFGFFRKNLVMEYSYPRAVADKVNVDFDVFRLSTAISEGGSTIEAGYWTRFRERETRDERLSQVDEDLTYQANELDRKVVSLDQIRTVVREIRDQLPAMFPDRNVDEHGRLEHIPKTLIFAKDDSHAEDIVRIVREEFGKGNDVIAKITYKASDGQKPEDLLKAFRTGYFPRIAVTVDMIATGTDVKPIEMVVFMRSVKSRNFFEQMKGRGARTINDDDLQVVTPDAAHKDRFILVDAVGVTETKLIETTPLERKRGVSLEKLMQQVSLGQSSEDLVSTLASRIARIESRIGIEDQQRIEKIAGQTLSDIASHLVDAIDPDRQIEIAQQRTGVDDPSGDAIAEVRQELYDNALEPLAANPELRDELVNVQKSFEQVIDEISVDVVTRSEFAVDAKARAEETARTFRQFIEDNHDKITALEILYSRPFAKRLTYSDIKELAEAIRRPPYNWTTERLWEAYETLDASKVRGSAGTVLTNIVSIVRYALERDDVLEPYPERVSERFDEWLATVEASGRTFNAEQLQWLSLMRDHLSSSVSIEQKELLDAPFSQLGGLYKARELFGESLPTLLDELTQAVAA